MVDWIILGLNLTDRYLLNMTVLNTVDKIEPEYCCCCCCLAVAIGMSTQLSQASTFQQDFTVPRIVQSITQAHSSELIETIEMYQTEISPRIKKELGVERLCKYDPSCSQYAKEAIQEYGKLGALMAAGRILKCNPLSNGGYDPVRKS